MCIMIGSMLANHAHAQPTFSVQNHANHDLHRIYLYCIRPDYSAVTYVYGPIPNDQQTYTYQCPEAEHIKALKLYCSPWDVIVDWECPTYCEFINWPNATDAYPDPCDNGEKYYFRFGISGEPNCIDNGFLGISSNP